MVHYNINIKVVGLQRCCTFGMPKAKNSQRDGQVPGSQAYMPDQDEQSSQHEVEDPEVSDVIEVVNDPYESRDSKRFLITEYHTSDTQVYA